MTITIAPELEERLCRKASEEGTDIETAIQSLLSAAMDWHEQDRAETIEGIQRGLADFEAGRFKPASEVFAKMRAKIGAAGL